MSLASDRLYKIGTGGTLKGAVEAVLKLEDFPLYDYLKEKGVREGRAVGRAEGLQETILRVGTKRYGEPSAEARLVVESVSDFERLQSLVERLAEVESWEELLAER